MENLFLPKYIGREKIEPVLHTALQMPLSIIVAPMGYGKTTLIQNYLAKQKSGHTYWLTCGKNEIDDEWLWQKICMTIHTAFPELAKELAELKLPKTHQSVARVIQLLQAAIDNPLYLVIDDYQECDSPHLNSLMENLAYQKIENLHIILISRFFPDIPCHELWMKGCCSLLEQDLLTLDSEDLREFYRLNGIELDDDTLGQIFAVTDGWIAAAYLTLINYKKYGAFYNTENILLLLKESIFDKLSDRQKDCLMKLSVLDSFTPELAAYILDEKLLSPSMLGAASHSGFVKYDPATRTFRMHALFRELAEYELDQSVIDKDGLLCRCGEWFAQERHYIHAVVFFTKAGQPDRVWSLLDASDVELYEKAPVIFSNFFDSYGLDVKMNHPRAYIRYIYFLLMKENYSQGERLFKEAVKYCDLHLDRRHCVLRGELYIVESLLNFNDLPLMTECLKKAYELIGNNKSSIFDSTRLVTFGAPEMIALYLNRPGTLKDVLVLEKEYMSYFTYILNCANNEWDEMIDAEYYFITGDFETAEKYAQIACEKAKRQKRDCVVISCYYILLTCDIFYGRITDFSRKMQQFEEDIANIGRQVVLTDFELVTGHLYAMLGKLDFIAPWLKELDLENCNFIVRSARSACIVYGVILIRQERWAALESVAAEMGKIYGLSIHIKSLVLSKLYHCIAAFHLFGHDEAMTYLDEAVQLAEPDHLSVPLIRNYIFLEQLIKEYAQHSEFVAGILPECEQFKKGLQLLSQPERITKFTGREQDIIKLLREGCRNTEISARLHIATVTVEKTLKNIYHKLGVSNRTGAILKLEELNP